MQEGKFINEVSLHQKMKQNQDLNRQLRNVEQVVPILILQTIVSLTSLSRYISNCPML